MAYQDLSPEDQALLDAWLNEHRAWCGAIQRVTNAGITINDSYNATVSAILATLAGSDEIPNAGGLPGADALTKDQVVTLVSYLQGIHTNYYTEAHRQNYVRAAGVPTSLGV